MHRLALAPHKPECLHKLEIPTDPPLSTPNKTPKGTHNMHTTDREQHKSNLNSWEFKVSSPSMIEPNEIGRTLNENRLVAYTTSNNLEKGVYVFVHRRLLKKVAVLAHIKEVNRGGGNVGRKLLSNHNTSPTLHHFIRPPYTLYELPCGHYYAHLTHRKCISEVLAWVHKIRVTPYPENQESASTTIKVHYTEV